MNTSFDKIEYRMYFDEYRYDIDEQDQRIIDIFKNNSGQVPASWKSTFPRKPIRVIPKKNWNEYYPSFKARAAGDRRVFSIRGERGSTEKIYPEEHTVNRIANFGAACGLTKDGNGHYELRVRDHIYEFDIGQTGFMLIDCYWYFDPDALMNDTSRRHLFYKPSLYS